MALISFKNENDLIQSGSYLAKIIEIKNTIIQDKAEEIFVIEWQLENGRTIKNVFKLWSSNEEDRLKANKKLKKVLKALNININFDDETINFDSDLILKKECIVDIDSFVNKQGHENNYIKDYKSLPKTTKASSSFIEDEIVF